MICKIVGLPKVMWQNIRISTNGQTLQIYIYIYIYIFIDIDI